MPITIVSQALDLVFPPRCVGCGAVGAVLCAKCRATFRAPEPPLCPRCGLARVASVEQCPVCGQGRGPRALDGLRVAVVYEGVARLAVLALKFQGQRRLAEPLGALLAALCEREAIAADIVVPVALHPARQRQRGYNQSALLARHCAARLRLPLETRALVRSRDTAPQAALPAAERPANVAGAFALAPNAATLLAGKRILLIDDVTTTGSTIEAAATALRGANPAAIWGAALARPDEKQPELNRHTSPSL